MIDEKRLNEWEAYINSLPFPPDHMTQSFAFQTTQELSDLIVLARLGLEYNNRWKEFDHQERQWFNYYEEKYREAEPLATWAKKHGIPTVEFYSKHCAVVPAEYSSATREHIMRESMIPAKRAMNALPKQEATDVND